VAWAQEYAEPNLTFDIPEVEFSEPINEEGFLQIAFIGEYITGVYQFLIGFSITIAIIMLMVGGVQYMLGGGVPAQIQKAKGRMKNAVIGLILLLSTYLILYTTNPDLTIFDPITLVIVPEKPLSDGHYPIEGTPISGSTGEKPQNLDELDQCLYDNFLDGLQLGDPIPLTRIDMWGIKQVAVNEHSAHAWKKVANEINNLPDSSLAKGYLNYMRDYSNNKVPDLQGKQDGKGAVSQFQGGNGLGKGNKGDDQKFLRDDMHALGLSVDFMTRSNWDVSGIDEAREYCNIYQTTIEDNFEEGAYNGIFENLRSLDCGNLNDAKQINSIPQDFINVFESNHFYWAGNGWGEQNRTDGIHFEYYGPSCIEIRRKKG